jgi:uncharacterized protein (DUF983 family)
MTEEEIIHATKEGKRIAEKMLAAVKDEGDVPMSVAMNVIGNIVSQTFSSSDACCEPHLMASFDAWVTYTREMIVLNRKIQSAKIDARLKESPSGGIH